MSTEDPLALATRSAWPDELLIHYHEHPRPWSPRALPHLAAHWLEIHHAHRRHATALEAAPEPRGVASFLRGLQMHHHAESVLGFPALAAAAPEVARAFDVLERDHVAIDAMIRRVGAALAGPGLADALAPLLAAVRRHLHDEEDIVVPALVARGHLVRGL